MPARNRIHVAAPTEAVFAALADPYTYAEWVVGASRIRGADDDYPAVGSKLYHRVGFGPLSIADETEVLELEDGRRLVLDARLRPIGRARVELDVTPAENGSRVLMVEGPADSFSRVTMGGPLAEPLLQIRNTESLSRLKRIVEREGEPATDRDAALPRDRPRKVLITGASSGIGLAVARALAERGDSLALIARGRDGLEEARSQLGNAELVTIHPADTTRRSELEAAIDDAAEAHRGLDAVVANAAGAAFGPFADMDPEQFDATVRSVLLGTVDTARAALSHLEASSGVMVVVGSVAGRVPLPQLAAYSAAKHGLRGFLESLRAELADEGSPVRISHVQPWAVDSPFADNLTTATGLLPPADLRAHDPESVAAEILECLERPRAEVVMGTKARLAILTHSLARPVANAGLTLVSRYLRAGGDRPTEAEGALGRPVGRGRVQGNLKGKRSIGSFVAGGRGLARTAADRIPLPGR